MGRETKLLLGFLGLLAGAFVGVLAAKLFVPRPPAGAGPDINIEVAAESHELVEPPVPGPRAWDFAAAPPLAPAAPAPPRDPFAAGTAGAAAAPAGGTAGRYADRPAGRFDATGVAAVPADAPVERPRSPVTRVAWEAPPAAPPAVATAPLDHPDAAAAVERTPEPAPPAAPAFDRGPAAVPPAAALPVAGAASGYVVRPGDSWWHVAAAAYGDGRLYRALFAWNRAIDPRVALAPGTRLEIPPRPRLEAAWPRLLPAAASSAR